jgi:hypothetical protein
MRNKYNTFANEFACAVRLCGDNRDQLLGAWRLIDSYCRMARVENANFDPARFENYVAERSTARPQ